MRVQSYEDLEVYKLAFVLQQRVFELSKAWPPEERCAPTDQARRSARSIASNISEAWAKRRYEAHVVSKLTDADGELNETRHWLKSARAGDYLAEPAFQKLAANCDQIGGKLGRMIAGVHDWVQVR
jgi:four helix bundle protein